MATSGVNRKTESIPLKYYSKYIVKKDDTLSDILINKLGYSKKESAKFISRYGKHADKIFPGQEILYIKSGSKRDIMLCKYPKTKKMVASALKEFPKLDAKAIKSLQKHLTGKSHKKTYNH